MTVLSTIPLTTNNETMNETAMNETTFNNALKEINGVLRNAIDNNNGVLDETTMELVLIAIRELLETVINENETANEVDLADVLETLLETASNEAENENKESKTWNEPCFLDRMGASPLLKEWAERTTDHFIELYSENMWNAHPDETAVRVPVRFHRELRNIGVPVQSWKPGNGYLWNGVWYFPADREFLIIVREE